MLCVETELTETPFETWFIDITTDCITTVCGECDIDWFTAFEVIGVFDINWYGTECGVVFGVADCIP